MKVPVDAMTSAEDGDRIDVSGKACVQVSLSSILEERRQGDTSGGPMAAKHIAFLGSYPPRRCGIATFTADLSQAVTAAMPESEVTIVAMNDGTTYPYPSEVAVTVEQSDLACYEAAAESLNARACDVLCVQHEFGIFGGPDGSYLLSMLRRVHAPIVTTLHTVLERFTPSQAAVIEELAALSSRLVVMSERAVGFLVSQGVPARKILLVPHGVPDVLADRATEKERMGLSGRDLVLTFGLLSPNKGIETAVRALPTVVRRRPDVLYLVLGATHPHIRARHGEAYRESLVALADRLGVSANVRFDDIFSDIDGITRALAAADICLLPYQGKEQITSGTLAYAIGNGKAVVSTPFWHAEELLADGRGLLAPFGDHDAMGEALCRLLSDREVKADMERRAREYGTRMRWPNVASSYADAFAAATRERPTPLPQAKMPSIRLDHVVALTDDTGTLQHATFSVPNLREGYTTDDNARSLHLSVLTLNDPRAIPLARRTISFLAHAWNPAAGRFRNFMAYDRRWLDEDGGDNAQARAIRALVAASHGLPGALSAAARETLARSWPAAWTLCSPRAQAITLVALAEVQEHGALTPDLHALADRYTDALLRLLETTSAPSWNWFEDSLSYSNAKLPHGLIAYGRAVGHERAIRAGLDTLGWLDAQQTGPDGDFMPVGSERPYARGAARPFWDGQPIEVYATVSAALEAHRATGAASWLASARRAIEWLLGRNALRVSLYDHETGGCRDGLHRDRANENQGAESTLALWLSLAEYVSAAKLVVTAGPLSARE